MEAGAVATGPALDVVVRNGYAFLATSYGGLRVINVREPAAPAEVAAVHSSTNGEQIVRVRLSGDRLYALQPARGKQGRGSLWVLRFAAPGPVADSSQEQGTRHSRAGLHSASGRARRHLLKPPVSHATIAICSGWNRFLALSA
jgi:hypothetical protein